MRLSSGEVTIGDAGVDITATADETLATYTLRFEFIKPSGKMLDVAVTSVSGQTATYTFASGDIDESGEWAVMLRNVSDGFYYQNIGRFKVNPTPREMSRS